jgi:large subunit ribosomal protein L10
MKTQLFLLPLVTATAAFTGVPLTQRSTSQSSNLFMGGASKYATSLTGKKETVVKVKELLDTSQMVFTVPSGSMTVKQSQNLRRSMPEGTTMTVVKNKLMLRALEGSEYEAAVSLVKGPNMWFFIEDDIGATIKAFNQFCKVEQKKESHPILGGVIEGEIYDSAGVDAIGKLPSKLELYAQIAGSIKAVPTKVARVIKAPSSKLARAIKLATEKNEN